MTPLRVALIHRDSPRAHEQRMVGFWGYDVPEFDVEYFPMPKTWEAPRSRWKALDVIVYEDAKTWGTITGDDGPPIVYMVGDSTLSEDHLFQRQRQAKRLADLVLVDWDRLSRFTPHCPKVRRLGYCVNDRIFYGRARDPRPVDVAFHCYVKGMQEREQLATFLWHLCKDRKWTLARGVRAGTAYADAFRAAKVVVNLNRTPDTRAHRTLDAMACGACFLSTPLPEVSGEQFRAGTHYDSWHAVDDLERELRWLLEGGTWFRIAEQGQAYVMENHTWAIRATQLRAILGEELGL